MSTNFVSALHKAINNSDLGFFKKALLRRALRNPDNVLEAQQMCYEAAVEEQQIENSVSVQAVDWDAIIAFLEKLLPLILKLIGMFQ